MAAPGLVGSLSHEKPRLSLAVARRAGSGERSAHMSSRAGALTLEVGGKASWPSNRRIACSVSMSFSRSNGLLPQSSEKSRRPTAQRSTGVPYPSHSPWPQRTISGAR